METNTGLAVHNPVWSIAASLSAFAAGGVSYSYAFYGASGSYAYVGSRLAFRGKIVKAQSVAAYKAVSEVA